MFSTKCLLHPTLSFIFRKEISFECLCFSEHDIQIYLYVFWLRKPQSIEQECNFTYKSLGTG